MLPVREEVRAPGPGSIGTTAEAMKARLRDYLQLTKARLSLTVALSGVVGYWLGASTIDPAHLLWFLAATLLVVGAANAFNQVLERELDARMQRTAQRPIPTGRIDPAEAAFAAGLASVLGLVILVVHSGPLTGSLGVLALAIYVLVYTPMKPLSSWSTLPGAVSGAVPTLMGFSAAAGMLAPPAWCLFGVLFFWQFPHTWAIAATYREDYERVGYRALPTRAVAAGTVAATVALFLTSLLPAVVGDAGPFYTAGAVVLGAAFLVSAVRFGNGTRRSRATALLATSLLYLPLILALAAFSGRGF
jgi:protoheme IX farnesyltransferase